MEPTVLNNVEVVIVLTEEGCTCDRFTAIERFGRNYHTPMAVVAVQCFPPFR